MYVVFEGPDFSGKTSQIAKLKEYLEAQGKDVLCVKEPEVDVEGLNIDIYSLDFKRDYDTCFAVTHFMTGMRHLTMRKIRAHLEKPNAVVLSDRNLFSTLVYQGILGCPEGSEERDHVFNMALGTGRFEEPMMSFILDSVRDLMVQTPSMRNRYDEHAEASIKGYEILKSMLAIETYRTIPAASLEERHNQIIEILGV